jgi:hypothetical protein
MLAITLTLDAQSLPIHVAIPLCLPCLSHIHKTPVRHPQLKNILQY